MIYYKKFPPSAKSSLKVIVHSDVPSPGTITGFPSSIRFSTWKLPLSPCTPTGTDFSPYRKAAARGDELYLLNRGNRSVEVPEGARLIRCDIGDEAVAAPQTPNRARQGTVHHKRVHAHGKTPNRVTPAVN